MVIAYSPYDISIVQLREPITISDSVDYACLPPPDPSGAWYSRLPLELTAWGWGQREPTPHNSNSRANRLQYVQVVTRTLPGWSEDLYWVTNYEWIVSMGHTIIEFHLLSPFGTNGTASFGDSGAGVVLRRRQQKDVLYGVGHKSSFGGFSLNESGGEPKRNRYFAKAVAVPYILGGECQCGKETLVISKLICLDLCFYLRLCNIGTRYSGLSVTNRIRLGTVYLPRGRLVLPDIRPFRPARFDKSVRAPDWLQAPPMIIAGRGDRPGAMCTILAISLRHLVASHDCLMDLVLFPTLLSKLTLLGISGSAEFVATTRGASDLVIVQLRG